MIRKHRTPSRLVARLRPSPERFAAAAAAYDPELLVELHAARAPRTRAGAPSRPRPAR
jgi:hypothetical protein